METAPTQRTGALGQLPDGQFILRSVADCSKSGDPALLIERSLTIYGVVSGKPRRRRPV